MRQCDIEPGTSNPREDLTPEALWPPVDEPADGPEGAAAEAADGGPSAAIYPEEVAPLAQRRAFLRCGEFGASETAAAGVRLSKISRVQLMICTRAS